MKTNVCYLGDCLDVLKTLPENSIDSVCCDPPYELGFMGKSWDNSGIAYSVPMWKEVLRVLKPGGHLLSFSGTRTYHRMAVAIEDAGFEVRDMIEWIYGSGFPKSLNIGKAVDKLQGNEREVVGKKDINAIKALQKFKEQDGRTIKTDFSNIDIGITKGTSEWEGWGTALKPSHEPICMARKPLSEKTIAENCLKWGTGGINIDESRVGTEKIMIRGGGNVTKDGEKTFFPSNEINEERTGRFPANLIHDNSEEVRECFPESGGGKKIIGSKRSAVSNRPAYGDFSMEYEGIDNYGDSGNASRFFKSIIYQAKASKSERNKGCEKLEEIEVNVSVHQNTRCAVCKRFIRADYGDKGCQCENPIAGEVNKTFSKNNHPTVKPIALMSYLIKMVTPKGGIVLDPFTGSGSTLVAAKENDFQYIGIELTEEYLPIIQARTGCEIIKNTEDLSEDLKEPSKELEEEATKELLKDTCSCGGKIIKLKSGERCCEACLTDY